MRNSNWKLAAIIGLVAVVIVLAIVLVVTGHDSAPSAGLPDPDAPSVQPVTETPEPTAEPSVEPTERAVPDEVTLIGDSIMVAAEEALYEYIPCLLYTS